MINNRSLTELNGSSQSPAPGSPAIQPAQDSASHAQNGAANYEEDPIRRRNLTLSQSQSNGNVMLAPNTSSPPQPQGGFMPPGSLPAGYSMPASNVNTPPVYFPPKDQSATSQSAWHPPEHLTNGVSAPQAAFNPNAFNNSMNPASFQMGSNGTQSQDQNAPRKRLYKLGDLPRQDSFATDSSAASPAAFPGMPLSSQSPAPVGAQLDAESSPMPAQRQLKRKAEDDPDSSSPQSQPRPLSRLQRGPGPGAETQQTQQQQQANLDTGIIPMLAGAFPGHSVETIKQIWIQSGCNVQAFAALITNLQPNQQSNGSPTMPAAMPNQQMNQGFSQPQQGFRPPYIQNASQGRMGASFPGQPLQFNNAQSPGMNGQFSPFPQGSPFPGQQMQPGSPMFQQQQAMRNQQLMLAQRQRLAQTPGQQPNGSQSQPQQRQPMPLFNPSITTTRVVQPGQQMNPQQLTPQQQQAYMHQQQQQRMMQQHQQPMYQNLPNYTPQQLAALQQSNPAHYAQYMAARQQMQRIHAQQQAQQQAMRMQQQQYASGPKTQASQLVAAHKPVAMKRRRLDSESESEEGDYGGSSDGEGWDDKNLAEREANGLKFFNECTPESLIDITGEFFRLIAILKLIN